MKRFRPSELWINGVTDNERDYDQLLDLAKRLDIAIKVGHAGDILFQAGSSRLLCIHGAAGSNSSDNSRQLKKHRSGNLNDTSLVLRLETNDTAFLLPADISSKMADLLVQNQKPLKADVLLAPHHGSTSSVSQDFIEAVAPTTIIISAGQNNPFLQPAKSFTDLQDKGINVLLTGRDGTITFYAKDGKLEIGRYQAD